MIEPLVARLREIDYAGAVSIELMNPQLWEVPPRQFGEIAMTAASQSAGASKHVLVRSLGGERRRRKPAVLHGARNLVSPGIV